jgi:y4mF family transcriptional regulator
LDYVSDAMAKLASEIKARRQDLGLTQIQLARISGVSSSFIHNLEAGKPTVALDRVLLVTKSLGLRFVLELKTND